MNIPKTVSRLRLTSYSLGDAYVLIRLFFIVKQ